MAKIKQWTSLKVYLKEEERRMAGVLLNLVLILWSADLITLLVDWLAWGDKPMAVVLTLWGVFQLIPLFLVLQGKLAAANFTLTTSCILSITLVATFGQGVRDYVIILYPIAIMFAGLTSSRSGLAFSTLLTLASCAWLILAESRGLFVYLTTAPDSTDLLIVAIIILIAAWAVNILVANAEYGLAQTWHELADRKRAEELLQKNQENLRSLIENTEDAIWSIDRNYNLIIANSGFQKNIYMRKRSPLRVEENIFHEDIPPEVRVEWKGYYDRVLQGEKFSIELKRIRFGPEPSYIEFQFSPIVSENGGITGVTIFGRDSTNRKREEEALRRSEERFRAAQDLSLEAFTILKCLRDDGGRIIDFEWTYANKIAGQILKLDPQHLVGQRLLEYLPANRENEALFNRYIRIVESGEGNEVELEYQGEGIRGWFRNMAVKLEDGVAVSFSDITRRKQMEEALRASEANYRAVVENQTEFVSRFLPDTTLTFVNQAYCQYFGRTQAELIGGSFLQVVPLSDHEKVREHVRSLIMKTGRVEYEIEVTGVNGETVWQQWVDRTLHDENGKVVEIQSVGRDITELKKLQQKQQELVTLEERQRLARDLHDAVSQTLFSARLTSEMLLQNKSAISKTELWNNIQHFTHLVTGALGEMRVLLLELRPENLARADLPTLLGHLVDAAGVRTTATIKLKVSEKEKIPSEVKTAFYRIAQEALNNAIKHAQCRMITIHFSAEGGKAELAIEDNGLGTANLKQVDGTKMGLNIMEERAREINASFKITSLPRQGSKVSCIWKKQKETENEK